MHNKLLIALQSGKGAPDIADIEISKFPNYLKGKIQLAPLDDLLNPIRKNFVQARLDIYGKDGKTYGICFHVGAEVMYYNTDITNAAGVDIDKIDTWDDYVKAGLQVKAKTGKPMTTVETTDQWSFWPLISQQKSDYTDKSGNITIDNDINVKTLQFLSDLVNVQKIAVPAPGGFHHAEQYYGFMNDGGAASIWMPMWYMGRFTDYMPDLKGKIAIRPLPRWTKGGNRSAGMGGTGTAAITLSKNVQLAKEFVVFAKGSKEGNIEIWKRLGFDPVRWDVWSDPAMNEPNKFTQFFTNKNIFQTLLQVKDEIVPVNVNSNMVKVIDQIRQKTFVEAIQDKVPAAQALKEAAQAAKM
jgi:arabinosaccharide transport system substrate-binding protein